MTDLANRARVIGPSATAIVLPLALAQFIASFAATNMNVAINNISADLGTTVLGVQTAITLFTLIMAALMIPGSKLTDIWGRKPCLLLGLGIYGLGAVLSAVSLSLGVLIVGYSFLEGVGSALMIPPIYILITVLFTDITSRAKYFGIISAAGGAGAAAGPLIGGVITSAISWRASFLLQALVVAWIMYLCRHVPHTPTPSDRPAFDFGGAVLSAIGLVLVVSGVLLSRTYGWFGARQDFSAFGHVLIDKGSLSPVWLFMGAGALALLWFYLHIRSREKTGREPLLSTRLFHNRISNLGLATQTVQWLVMQGSFFVVSVFLQVVRGYSAIQTGLVLTASTAGILLSSAFAGRMAARRAQATLIRSGFLLTMVGMVLVMLFGGVGSNILAILPGLFAVGLGIGIMLTASVNVVQSSFADRDQGEISGLSRSVSNLGSSLGTALAGSVLVSTLVKGNAHFLLALLVMLVATIVGWLAAMGIPKTTIVAGGGSD
jgi:MFS family permease